jgi:purine-binding chemotaxis protein CheW
MALNLDKKMLTGFSQEVQSYLPEIRAGIANFGRNPTRPQALTEVLRHIHTIKGASAMIGFSALSQAASHIEHTLEAVVAGQLTIAAAQVEWLSLTVDHIEQYMASVLAGNDPAQTIVGDVAELLEAFTSPSEAAEDTLVADTVCEASAASPMTLPEAVTDTMLDEDDASTLLMDTALALSLDTLADFTTDAETDTTAIETMAAMEPVVPVPEAMVADDETLATPVATSELAPVTESPEEDAFVTDLLLDTALEELMDATSMATPLVEEHPATLPDDQDTSMPELTPAAAMDAEDTASGADEQAATAAFLEGSIDETLTAETVDTATTLPQDASTDAFTVDLLMDHPDLDFADSASSSQPQEEQTASDTADLPVSRYEPDAMETVEPLVATPGVLDTLLSSLDDDIQRTYATSAMSTVRQPMADGDGTLERYLLFLLHGRLYAVAIPHVLEVGRLPAITPLPNVPAWLRGVINLRGEILSVIDVRTFLGLEEGHYSETSRMLVVKTLGDDMTTSLVVDQVKGFVQLPRTSVQTTALSLEDKVAPYLTGVCEYGDQTLAVLDLERFLLSPEVRQFE